MKTRLLLLTVLVLAFATAAMAAEEPASVAGTWNFSAMARDVEQTFVIKQEGNKITGTFAPKGGFIGTGPLEGTVQGKSISFQVTTSHGLDIYKGTVDGETMKGTVTIGKNPDPVSWTAKLAR